MIRIKRKSFFRFDNKILLDITFEPNRTISEKSFIIGYALARIVQQGDDNDEPGMCR